MKILISYGHFPSSALDLQRAAQKRGWSALVLETRLDSLNKHLFWKLNKWAASLRIVPKGTNLFKSHPREHLNILTTKLQLAIKSYEPDLIFFIHGQPYGKEALDSITLPKVGWWVEPYCDENELVRNAMPFDWYYTFSSEATEVLGKQRNNVYYLNHCVNPERFFPLPTRKTIDLCLVANWSPRREKAIIAASEVTENICIFGDSWHKARMPRNKLKKFFRGKHIVGDELNRLINSSKVVLNVPRIENYFGLDMRLFEIPATRTCLLTEYLVDIPLLFAPGDLEIFKSLDELKSKLAHLLVNTDERERIANSGYLKVTSSYTYDHMLDRIKADYDRYRSQKHEI